MEGVGVLVPILITLGVFAMILGLRYFENREKMGMIEKGMNPLQDRPNDKTKNLRHGFLFLGVGFGLLMAKLLAEFVFTDSKSLLLYFAMGFLFGGLGLVVAHNRQAKETVTRTNRETHRSVE